MTSLLQQQSVCSIVMCFPPFLLQVAGSEHASLASNKFKSEQKRAGLLEPYQVLSWGLIMVRHCLSHDLGTVYPYFDACDGPLRPLYPKMDAALQAAIHRARSKVTLPPQACMTNASKLPADTMTGRHNSGGSNISRHLGSTLRIGRMAALHGGCTRRAAAARKL